jgi:predicted AlkP superfamily pyrophosphatase or phosphodiesterase
MRRIIFVLSLLISLSVTSFSQAYKAQPKLVVQIVVDQLRGDLPERYHDDFGSGGFRLFMDKGAWFTSCHYHYANTKTAPGHSSIGTGTYTLGHGIVGNEWWDPARRRIVTSVEDDHESSLGAAGLKEQCPAVAQQPVKVDPVERCGPSPRNLMTDTFADELRLATQGHARTYGIAFKDRAAVLPVGYSANGAFWIEHGSGAWLTSTYYYKEAPAWLVEFNASGAAKKYLDRDWTDRGGAVLRKTSQPPDAARPTDYYDLVGATPFANDYTLDLARTIIDKEGLGSGPVTDLISISFSATDILGHKVGPDSPEIKEMLIALDSQLAAFFKYLDAKVGSGNWVAAITSDHGVATMPDVANKLRFPAFNGDSAGYISTLNAMLATRYKREAQYVVQFDYPTVHLDSEAFAPLNVGEAEAEKTVGDLLLKLGMRGYGTKSQLAEGKIGNNVFAGQVLNAYSPQAGWYVQGIAPPFVVGYPNGTSHALPYSYDAHVPLGFYGPQFRPGNYRGEVEPVDLAVTLSSILHINKPASAVGRVLTEAIADQNHPTEPGK